MNTILFDLDGTLLPIQQEQFTKAYFSELIKKVAHLGYGKDDFVAAIWKGTGAMIKNDGARSNREVFWNVFSELYGPETLANIPVFDDFYSNEFDNVKHIIAAPCNRREMIDELRAKGYRLVLATNPIFPAPAVSTRLKWLGLEMSDFDIVTSYENSAFCKPNTKYFEALLSQLGKTASDCMMIGNNTLDDMAAEKMGMRCFLVTDHLENSIDADISAFENGSFEELEAFLKALPAVI